MAYTKFGEFVRVLRIKNHEVMGDMAKVLGASLPFLSAVENGKKNVPAEWIEKIVLHYNLTAIEKQELESAIEESRTQYKITPIHAGIQQRRAAIQFARSLDSFVMKFAMFSYFILDSSQFSPTALTIMSFPLIAV